MAKQEQMALEKRDSFMPVPLETISRMERVTSECGLQALEDKGAIERSFILAAGIKALRNEFTAEVMAEIMPLQNNALGFMTDNAAGYPVDVVRECVIEALLKGAYYVNNEFNIIGKRPFFTKSFYERKLREYPGLTDLKKEFGAPKPGQGTAEVPCVATWKLNGKPDKIEPKIQVRVNSGMAIDGILGKANKKLMAMVYQQLVGSESNFTFGDVEEAIDVTPKNSAVSSRLSNAVVVDAKIKE